MKGRQITVRFSEKADDEFMTSLATIFEMWGRTHHDQDARVLVVSCDSPDSERELKAQLTELEGESAPLTWHASAT